MSTAVNDARLHEQVDRRIHSAGIGTSTISDSLDALGIPAKVLPPMRYIGTVENIFHGAARPVQWYPSRKSAHITKRQPSTWSQVEEFILPEDTSGRGRVYCAGAGGLVEDAALLGGLSATYLAKVMEFEGAVLGGALRDSDLAGRSGMGLVYSNTTPVDTQGSYVCLANLGYCVIESVVISTGDWIFADSDGVVACPREALPGCLDIAESIEATERAMLDRLNRGERLNEIISETKRI